MRRTRVVGALATAGCLLGMLLAAPAQASVSASTHGRMLPQHLFAPYFETYAGSNLARAVQRVRREVPHAGLRRDHQPGLVHAGLGTATRACRSPGRRSAPTSRRSGRRRRRHPVVRRLLRRPRGTDIADSCTASPRSPRRTRRSSRPTASAGSTSTSRTTRSTNAAGHRPPQPGDRHGPGLGRRATAARSQFVYTLPTGTGRPRPAGVDVLQNAVQAPREVDIVNIMTFDYYDERAARDGRRHPGPPRRPASRSCAPSTRSEPPRSCGARLGITEMIGIDDFGPAETLTARRRRGRSERGPSSKGIASLSFWALQRDNGGCVGHRRLRRLLRRRAAAWEYTHLFVPFTTPDPR